MRTETFVRQSYNGVFKTIAVSFPRSGHHLLQRCLQLALVHHLNYSELYSCNQTIADGNINYQKTHDFDCNLAVEPWFKYVVQHRKFCTAIRSWFNLEVLEGRQNDSEKNFEEFALSKVDYYLEFKSYWCKEAGNRMVVPYEQFVFDVEGTVEKVLAFICVSARTQYNASWRRFCKNEQIFYKPNPIEGFRYYYVLDEQELLDI